MDAEWEVVQLSKKHDRQAFDCGKPELNEYLRRYARQNAALGVSRTFVAARPPAVAVGGYYSLSTGSIEYEELPPKEFKRLPKYPVPTAHLARLAVDRSEQGKGLGGVLLVNALIRVAAVAEEIGVCAVTVDAMDETARDFYVHHGFHELRSSRLHLCLPIGTIKHLLD